MLNFAPHFEGAILQDVVGLSYSVTVTQRFLVPHFLVRIRVGQPKEMSTFQLTFSFFVPVLSNSI